MTRAGRAPAFQHLPRQNIKFQTGFPPRSLRHGSRLIPSDSSVFSRRETKTSRQRSMTYSLTSSRKKKKRKTNEKNFQFLHKICKNHLKSTSRRSIYILMKALIIYFLFSQRPMGAIHKTGPDLHTFTKQIPTCLRIDVPHHTANRF